MGKPIVYCGQCGKSLPESEFTRGRAHEIDNVPYCTDCRPAATPVASPPKKPSSSHLAAPQKMTRRAVAAVPARPSPKAMGMGVGAAALGLIVLVIALSSGNSPELPASPPLVKPSPKVAPPPVDPGKRRAEEIEREMKARQEKERAAQFDRFLQQIREIVTNGRLLARRREEIEGMFASALKNAGDRKAEVEKLREEFLRRASLLGHWKLDETAGAAAEDATGNGHGGELSGGPSWTPGRVRGALAFDGADDGVTVKEIDGLSPQAAPAGEMTVAAWLRAPRLPPDAGQKRSPVVAKGDPQGWEYALYLYADSRFEFVVWSLSGANHAAATGGAAKLNQWHHLAGVYQRGKAARLYVDGQEVTVSSAFAGEAKAGAASFYIGRRGGAGQFFAGAVDDVRLYDRALSADEIKALYEKE